jgi:D-alanyl-D-alanine carboxypeptidase (penicillin-binding protein 5/6)
LILASSLSAVGGDRGAAAQDDLASQISSQRWIVIDADTGEVFAQHKADDEVAIASLTKIYTTIQALEMASLDTQITTNESDLFDANSTQVGFGPGETFSMEDLLYGMLLPSGNDAAHAVARALGMQPGDTDAQAVAHFVALENQRITDMGLTETHLVNPHGLGVPGHHSSAHDLAVFTRYALKFPEFVKIFGTASYTTANGYSFSNTNKLLSEDSELLGGKTGYDDDAGYCLVEVAQRDGSTMISVTLDGVAPDVWYQDNVTLLDYAFNQKAARIAKNGAIGTAVSYRDPDAVALENNATPGGAFGAEPTGTPASEPTAKAPNLTPFPDATPVVASSPGDSGGGSAGKILAVLAVVALVVIASALGSGWRPRGRNGPAPPG